MRFWSWHSIDQCWHGINVIMSVDGGESFRQLEPTSVSPSYDDLVRHIPSNAMAGQLAWCGESDGWREVEIDLEANLMGSDRSKAILVFQLGADSSGPRQGWYVDSVEIGSRSDLNGEEEPIVPEMIAFFDFEDDQKTPSDDRIGLSVGPMDNQAGNAGFVLGTPGRAITSRNWRVGDGNYFEFEIVPGPGMTVVPSSLSFDERGSATGPTRYEVFIVLGDEAHPVVGSVKNFVPGGWSSQRVQNLSDISGADTQVFESPFKVRIGAEGATSAAGTWRLDNVRLTANVIGG